MDLYRIEKHTPSCLSRTNGSIIIHDMSVNQLSFSWLNLPEKANISDKGRSVSNLDCGNYFLEIYNFETKTTDNLEIKLNCEHLLSIDLVQIEGINCYEDRGVLNVSWSGGKPPYTISVNQHYFVTNDQFYSTDIVSNVGHNITIKDSQNCIASKKNIIKTITPLDVNVRWTPIKFHNNFVENLSFDIKGGTPPYKSALFLNDSDKPIIVNTNSIDNKLQSGKYKLLIKDSNDCQTEKTFEIANPAPIIVNIRHSADYGSLYSHEFINVGKIYNLVLLNKKHIDIDLDNIKQISIVDKKRITEQRKCMDYGDVSIGNQKYYYFYITPGLSEIKDVQSVINIDGQEIIVKHDTVFNSSNKLIVGSLFLNHDNTYAFEDNIKIDLIGDTDNIEANLSKFYVHNGMYFSFSIYTHLNFIAQENSAKTSTVLKFINNNNSILIKSNHNIQHRKGEIYCSIYNSDPESIRAELTDSQNNTTYHTIENNQLSIKNLSFGKYTLKILDDHNTANLYNNLQIDDGVYNLNILDSFEKEQNLSQELNSHKYSISTNRLNQYQNHLSKKILFSSPNYKNGVLVNICPLDACFQVLDNDNNIVLEDCGHQIIDIPKGRYLIKVFKEGYMEKYQEFFHNNKKDLATVVLNKEADV